LKGKRACPEVEKKWSREMLSRHTWTFLLELASFLGIRVRSNCVDILALPSSFLVVDFLQVNFFEPILPLVK